MKWYALLSLAALVALASSQSGLGLTQPEFQAFVQYYSNHRRPCGDAQFSVLVADAENYTLRTTGIPTHPAYRTSPYRAAIQELTYSFPRQPVALEKPLCVPNGVPIGFALDGVPFYNPLSKDWNNAIEGSCAKVFDRCGGNVDKHNQYYYSELPNFDQQCMDLNRAQETVHIGVAIDGFPIYYERRFNASLLDECGGRYLDTTNKRFYRYVVSDQFPYTLGCFRGKVHNISTLTYCKGNKGEYGKLCTCVNVGPPGMAIGFKWQSKDALTVGQCTRRPVVQERSRDIICNRDEIPEPDFQEEDRRSKSCLDFRALYSLIVIQGHKGGLAPWTRLKNHGREEDMKVHKEDSEYIQHFKALRWLLSDLHVLDYPELEKYEKMKNQTKPLCPKEQLKLRNALARTWVVAFLREAHKLRPEGSDYEKEEVKKAYKRLMYVLKTLKVMEITAYVKKPEKKEHIDPWGVWIKDDEEDDHDEEEKMKEEEEKLGALMSQLTALQTLGQLKEAEKKEKEKKKKDGKKSGGGDGDKEMRAKLLSLLYEVQGMSGDGKQNKYGGGGEGNHCEGDQGEGDQGEGHGVEGSRGRRRGGEGHGSEGDRGQGRAEEGYGKDGKEGDDCKEDNEMHEEGMEDMKEVEDGMRRGGRYRGRQGEGYGMGGMRKEGGRDRDREGEGYGMGGMRREGGRDHGREGEGYGMGGMRREGEGYHGREGEGYGMGGMRREGGRYHGREGEGYGIGGMRREGGRYHGREGEGYGMGGMRRDGGQGQGEYRGKEVEEEGDSGCSGQGDRQPASGGEKTEMPVSSKGNDEDVRY